MECDHTQNFEHALATSSAIFEGKAIGQRSELAQTTHHGRFRNVEINFAVSRSWKSINVESVWLRTSDRNLRCGKIEVGQTYLVYALSDGEELYIHPDSRTFELSAKTTQEDLLALGEPNVRIGSNTEFFEPIVVGSVVIVVLILFFVVKRIRHS